MKKTLIAAALIAGFAGAAHAENSVTLYGIVDGGIGYSSKSLKVDGVKVKKESSYGVIQGALAANRFGLKGVEDLGNGTSAIFQLESGFHLGTGETTGGAFFERKAIIGLQGDSWGRLTAGRQGDATDELQGAGDAFGGNVDILNVWGDNINGGRHDAVVKYVTPDMSGLQLGLSWNGTNKKVNGVRTADNNFSVAAAYSNGPLGLSASFNLGRINEAGSKSTSKAYALEGSYDFGAFGLFARFGQAFDMGAEGGNFAIGALKETGVADLAQGKLTGKGARQTSYGLGVTANVSDAGKVYFAYDGSRNTKREAGNKFRAQSNVFRLAYTESLSKRTTAYVFAGYGWTKYRGFAESKVRYQEQQYGIGLNHAF